VQDPRQIQELMQKGLKELQSMKVCADLESRNLIRHIVSMRVQRNEYLFGCSGGLLRTLAERRGSLNGVRLTFLHNRDRRLSVNSSN
jgi:hypothetical protein